VIENPTPCPVRVDAVPAPSGGPSGTGSRWTGGRVAAVVLGAVLLFLATGPLAAGGGLLAADSTHREGAYLMGGRSTISSDRYAVTSDGIRLEGAGFPWAADNLIGTARLEATALEPGTALFVGVAPTAEVQQYLSGAGHQRVADLGMGMGRTAPRLTADVPGGAPAVAPGAADIWTARATGPTASLTWHPAPGDWTVVLMRADGGPGVAAAVRAGATVPGLSWLAGGLLTGGAVLFVAGGLLIGLAVHRVQQPPPSYPSVPRTPEPRDPVDPGAGQPTPAPSVLSTRP
jgi:hypothetical protein